jgi:hypothetical protein
LCGTFFPVLAGIECWPASELRGAVTWKVGQLIE